MPDAGADWVPEDKEQGLWLYRSPLAFHRSGCDRVRLQRWSSLAQSGIGDRVADGVPVEHPAQRRDHAIGNNRTVLISDRVMKADDVATPHAKDGQRAKLGMDQSLKRRSPPACAAKPVPFAGLIFLTQLRNVEASALALA